jgi:uncharacterized protein (TIGR03437 family)
VDSGGDLYIADIYSNHIRKVSQGVITTVAGGGLQSFLGQGFSGDNGPATGAQLNVPMGIAVDRSGNLFIADTFNNRIRRVTNGVITTVAGNGTPGFSGDNGPAPNAQLNLIGAWDGDHRALTFAGVAVDLAGNIFVTDTNNHRIRMVSNGVITTVAGNGTPGFSGDNGPAANAKLNSPRGIAVDSAGNLFFADTGNYRVRRISGGIITTIAGDGTDGSQGIAPGQSVATNFPLYNPNGIAVDAAGNNIYISGTGGVAKVTGALIAAVAGTWGIPPNPPCSGVFCGAYYYSQYPFGLAIDSNNALYVANFLSQIFKFSNGASTVIAGTGMRGFSGDDGPAISAQLNSPYGTAVDSSGRVYISDNNRIRLLTPTTSSCSYAVSATSLQALAAGSNLAVGIQTGAACPWTISNLPAWITVSGASSSTGSATVTLVVASNPGSPRNATVLIAGVSVTIAQPAKGTGQNAPTVLDAVTSNVSGLSNGMCSIPPVVSTFTPASQYVWIYFDVGGAAVGDSARVDIYRPDGTLYQSLPTLTFGSNGDVCASEALAISGTQAASILGLWSIQVSWNNAALFKMNFALGLSAGLMIVPTYDNSITASPNAEAIKTSIKAAIGALEALFSDPIYVLIYFRYSTTQPDGQRAALSNSYSGYYYMPYGAYINALKADSKTPNDATAVGNLPTSSLATNIDVSSALARALGMNWPGYLDSNGATGTGGIYDGIVTINSSQPFQFARTGGISAGSYDAQRMVEHEMDEVLGLKSILPSSTDASGNSAIMPEDLFRYSAPRLTSLTSSASATAYLSIDRGVTSIVGLNQSGGDYGDWLSPSCGAETITPLVQYYVTCPGTLADVSVISPEGIALDVIGYDLRSSAPTIMPGGIVPVYSSVTTIQPGEWVSIYGTNLASSTLSWNGNFPTSLGGTSVTINGKAAYLWFVSPTQINLQAPGDIATGSVPVVVTTASGTATSTVMLAQFAPSFLLLDTKHVAGIILRSDGSGAYGGGTYDILGPTGTSLGYATIAAKAGDIVEIFAGGLGPTNPAVPPGQAFSGAAQAINPVTLLVNNVRLTPTFAGLVSAGLYQVNLTIPASLGTGDVSLVATVGGVQTPPNVVIPLR